MGIYFSLQKEWTMIYKSYTFIYLLLILLATSCSENHREEIDLTYRLTGTNPDSALTILTGFNHNRLSKEEQARYSLIYTIAQDKSGQDVDDDSLLRTAYTYNDSRPDDSLYAKCQYYRGKYYMLNDSTAFAVDCLNRSAASAKTHGDRYIQSL